MAEPGRYASSMAFVGRGVELATLAGALERAAGGRMTCVLVAGPLGMGISTLLDEFTGRLADVPDVIVCRGRCLQSRAGVAYAAIADALATPLAALTDSDLADVAGSSGHDLTALLPALGDRFEAAGIDFGAPSLAAPDQLGARVQEALIGLVDRLARRGVLLLVIEDLEHSDPATREFIEALLRLSRPLPLALLLAHHPDEVNRQHPAANFLRGLGQQERVELVELASLTRDEVAELATAVDGERATLGLAAALLEGSGGNPLLVSQLLAARRTVAGVRLSDPLEEIIHARLAQLSPATVRALRLLAAAARPIDEQALLQLRTSTGRIAPREVEQAIGAQLAIRGDGGVAVVHELVAEAITALATPAQRLALHAALARGLSAEPAEAAWHWGRARQPRQARSAHVEAAAVAARLDPGQTALFHLQHALELADGDVETLAAAATAADAAGGFRRAATLTEQALSLATSGNIDRFVAARPSVAERVRVGQLFEALGRRRRAGGDADGARKAFERALELIPVRAAGRASRRADGSIPDIRVERAVALAALAQDLMLEGRFAESAPLAEAACAAAGGAGEPALPALGHATCTLGVDAAYLGDLARGLTLLEQATEHSRAAGRLDDVIRAYANRTTLLDLDGRREEALAVVKEGIAEAERNGLGLTYGAFLRGNAADILFQLGRWTESETECRAALEFPPAGVAWFSPLLYLALVLVESRADDEAASLVGQTLLQLEAVPAGQWSALVLRAAVSLALWRAEPDDARQAAASGWPRVLETADAGQIAAAAATVLEACAAAADAARIRRDWAALAEAGALAESTLPAAETQLAGSGLDPRLSAHREAELYLATARAHEARLRERDTPERWADLAETWQQAGVPYLAAKCLWWQAGAALREAGVEHLRSRRAEARRAIIAALPIADRLPAQPLRRALIDLAVRGSLPLPAKLVPRDALDTAISDDADGERLVAVGPGRVDIVGLFSPSRAQAMGRERFGLSPREYGVLLVLAEGRTNREIAERLFISERTVAIHVRRILAKLGVSGRVEATGVAIRLGLVPADETPRETNRAALESATIG
jgi:DNA-binding NarL/FixJ family response regulator/tetratricopeptide (TPR) repeat protein